MEGLNEPERKSWGTFIRESVAYMMRKGVWNLLLLRSGDVEANPGPGSAESFDKEVRTILATLRESKLKEKKSKSASDKGSTQ